MSPRLFTIALIAGLATAGPATFKTGSNAHTIGLYGSAARHWRTIAEKGYVPVQYNVGRMR
jgi:hypothetical protein